MGKHIDLTGKKFGRLTVISKSYKRDKSGNVYWNCKCDCGKEVEVRGRNLKDGHTKSCGCIKNELWEKYIDKCFKDMTGEKYGNLVVLERGEDYIYSDNRRTTQWLCQCGCGNTLLVSRSALISGNTKSCGCKNHCYDKIHGQCGTKLYHIWQSMKARCYYKKHPEYHNYGGRGIKICDEWKNDFKSFYDWAIKNGYKDGLTIDRIDVNGNYEYSNCRWATRKEQSNNRRNNHIIEFIGEKHTIAEWSEITGINEKTLYSRIRNGWSEEDVITKKVRRKSEKAM